MNLVGISNLTSGDPAAGRERPDDDDGGDQHQRRRQRIRRRRRRRRDVGEAEALLEPVGLHGRHGVLEQPQEEGLQKVRQQRRPQHQRAGTAL